MNIGPDLIPAWMSRGLCARIDPELWFPRKGKSTRPARSICLQCPVRSQCLMDALEAPVNPDGIWGGTTEKERRPMRAAMRGEAA